MLLESSVFKLALILGIDYHLSLTCEPIISGLDSKQQRGVEANEKPVSTFYFQLFETIG